MIKEGRHPAALWKMTAAGCRRLDKRLALVFTIGKPSFYSAMFRPH
jgi:hypothetical protein